LAQEPVGIYDRSGTSCWESTVDESLESLLGGFAKAFLKFDLFISTPIGRSCSWDFNCQGYLHCLKSSCDEAEQVKVINKSLKGVTEVAAILIYFERPCVDIGPTILEVLPKKSHDSITRMRTKNAIIILGLEFEQLSDERHFPTNISF